MTIFAKSINFGSETEKKLENMGLGSYWVRKDDHTGEAKTLKPWEEAISNGDKYFPDPNKKNHPEDEEGQ